MTASTETPAPPAGRDLLVDAEAALPLAYRQVIQALRHLDGQASFIRAHATPGHDFATLWQRRASHLTPAQFKYGYNIAVVYSRQLTESGLVLPSLQEVDATQVALSDLETKRRAAREETPRATAETVPAPTRSSIALEGTSTLIIKFDYDPRLITAMHDLRAKRDRLAERERNIGFVEFSKVGGPHWESPVELLQAVVATFPDFKRDARVEALLREQAEVAAKARAVLAAKERAERERVAALAKTLGKLSEPLANGRTLYKHQREGIIALARWGSGILGDQMGLGKTGQACVLAKAYHDAFGARVVIVGPKTLRTNWMREAAGIGLHTLEYYTYERMPTHEDMSAGIDGSTPYVLFIDEADAFQSLTAKRTKRIIPLAWGAMACVPMSGTPARNGLPINLYPLLLMTRHELVYAAHPDGSPDEEEIRRRKSEYVRRYCASDGPPVVVNGTQIVSANGARQLDQLYRMIKDTPRGLLRRRKDQCLDLPRKVRKFYPVAFSPDARQAYYADLDEMWTAYQSRLEAKIQVYKDNEWQQDTQAALASHIEANGAPKDEETFDKLYKTLQGIALRNALERLNAGEALVTLGHLRHCGARAKLGPTMALIKDIVEQDALDAAQAANEGRPYKPATFIVFSAFVEIARSVAREAEALGLRAGIITGDTKPRDRDKYVDAFQSGDLRVMTCVYGAGGVGITLTKATHVILLDRPWTPGGAEQAEDRAHRIGLEEDVMALWVQIPESVSPIDYKVDGILLQKQERSIKMLDGDVENMPADVLFRNIAPALIAEAMAARRAKKTNDD